MSLETQLAAVVARIRSQFNTVKGQINTPLFFAIGTSTADTDDTETDLTWTQVGGRVDSGYTHSEGSASIRLDSPGWYKIEYAAGLNISTNANRGELTLFLYQDTGSGFVQIANSLSADYVVRDGNQNIGGTQGFFLLETTQDNVDIKVTAQTDTDGTLVATLDPAQTRILIEKK